MLRSYSVRIAWERFELKKAILAVVLVLSCCFAALFATAKPAIAEKNSKMNYINITQILQSDRETPFGKLQKSGLKMSRLHLVTKLYIPL